MRKFTFFVTGSLILVACGSSSSSESTSVGSLENSPPSTAIETTTTSTTRPPDVGPNTSTGHVVLAGLPGAGERCNDDGNRKIAIDWQAPADDYTGPPLPLHLGFTGAGGNYAGPHPFGWQAPAGLKSKDTLEGAFNVLIRFECMNSPEYPKLSSGPRSFHYLADIGFNPHDVDYVYELLCTDLHEGTADAGLLVPIDTSLIDCTRVGLRGHSGGALTAMLFLNECFEEMSITPNIRAIAGVVGGFFPLGFCSDPGVAGFDLRTDSGIPLFLKIACEDERIPYSSLVRDQWQNLGSPKFLYSRNGGHSETTGPGGADAISARLLSGEGLILDFMRYYLLGDEGPSGLGALDDYPDVQSVEGFVSSYQYDGPFGTKLDGGIC